MWFDRFAAALAAGVFLALPAPLDGQAFEGVVTYSMNPASARPGTMIYQVKGTKVRADLTGLKGSPHSGMYMLMDAVAGKMMSVMPAQRVYMTMDMKAMSEQMRSPEGKPVTAKITKTGKTETIAGYKCEHYLIGAQQDSDICAAKGLGIMGAGTRGMFAGMPGYEAYAEFAKDGFLPLKVTSLRNGKRAVVMEARSVERKRLDPSLFVVPEGYAEMDMGKMMQQRQKPSGR